MVLAAEKHAFANFDEGIQAANVSLARLNEVDGDLPHVHRPVDAYLSTDTGLEPDLVQGSIRSKLRGGQNFGSLPVMKHEADAVEPSVHCPDPH